MMIDVPEILASALLFGVLGYAIARHVVGQETDQIVGEIRRAHERDAEERERVLAASRRAEVLTARVDAFEAGRDAARESRDALEAMLERPGGPYRR